MTISRSDIKIVDATQRQVFDEAVDVVSSQEIVLNVLMRLDSSEPGASPTEIDERIEASNCKTLLWIPTLNVQFLFDLSIERRLNAMI